MNALEKTIRDIIAAQGAISMAAYMELALQHPQYGYYRAREPLGRTGDFVTAPEISQMFGEMIGVWCAEAWRELGKPDPFALIELGPGRGTMMLDVLRATTKAGGFHAAKRLYLVDSNKTLQEKQREILGDSAPKFLDDFTQTPSLPSIIIANEFFDALPVRQFEKTFRGWSERMITVENNALAVTLRPLQIAENNFIPPTLLDAAPGTVFETSPKAQSIVRELSLQLKRYHGAMLIVDYGYGVASGLPTVQAISHHAHANIFERPGEIDLTAHIDFTSLAHVAYESGLNVSPLVSQGEFLKNLGIEIRAEALKKRATPLQAAEIDSALHRLIDTSQMGQLFKTIEVRG